MFASKGTLLSSHKCCPLKCVKWCGEAKLLVTGRWTRHSQKNCYKHCIMTRAVCKCTEWEINHILCKQTSALYLDYLLQKLQNCAAVVGIITGQFSTTHEFKEDKSYISLKAIRNFLCKVKRVDHFLQETQYDSIQRLLPSTVEWIDKLKVQCWLQCIREFRYE